MELRKILLLEPTLLEQRDGQGVAHCERRGRARRRRKSHGAGLFCDGHIQRDGAILGQRRTHSADDRHNRNAHALHEGQELQNFLRLSAIRNRNEHIAARQHAEVAVEPFGWMEKKRRCPGTRHRGGDLLPDQPGFAHARYDDFALAVIEQVHGLREPTIETLNEGLDGTRFDVQHTPAYVEAGSALRRRRPSALRLGYFRGCDASHIRMTRSSKAL